MEGLDLQAIVKSRELNTSMTNENETLNSKQISQLKEENIGLIQDLETKKEELKA